MAKIDTSLQLDAVAYCSMRALLTAEVDAGMHQEGAILANPSAAMGLLWARRGLSFWLEIYRLSLPEGYAEGAEDNLYPNPNPNPDPHPNQVGGGSCQTPPSIEGCPSPLGSSGGNASAQAGGRRASCRSPALRSGGSAASAATSFKDIILDAYARTCQPFNGFLTRRSFDFTLGVVPVWPEVALELARARAGVALKLAPTEALLHEDMARWVAVLDRLLPAMERLHKALDLEDQRKSFKAVYGLIYKFCHIGMATVCARVGMSLDAIPKFELNSHLTSDHHPRSLSGFQPLGKRTVATPLGPARCRPAARVAHTRQVDLRRGRRGKERGGNLFMPVHARKMEWRAFLALHRRICTCAVLEQQLDRAEVAGVRREVQRRATTKDVAEAVCEVARRSRVVGVEAKHAEQEQKGVGTILSRIPSHVAVRVAAVG
eukprot:scaffold3458_cov66-Phaeocystis_antarctica.AAC.4